MYGRQLQATETWSKTTTITSSSRQQGYVATSQSIAYQGNIFLMVRHRHSAHVEGLTVVAALHYVRWPQHQRSWLPHGRQISVTAFHPHMYADSLHAVHLLTSHYNARSALHTRLISPAGVSKAGRHLAHSCTTSIAHHDLSRHVFSATRSHKTLNHLITQIYKKFLLTFMPCLSHRSSCQPRALRLLNCIDDPCV